MPQVTLQQAFDLAVQHHQAGRLAEAEAVYRQILAVEPNQPETLHYLGLVAYQFGRPEEAIELLEKALAIKPAWPEALNNLAATRHGLGQFAAAIVASRQAISLNPKDAEAHFHLGFALASLGQKQEAIAAFRQAATLKPDYLQALINLSVTLNDTGQWHEAISVYRQVIALKPDLAEAYNDLGNALKAVGQGPEAIIAFQQAHRLKPDFAEAYNNGAIVLRDQGQLDEAISAYRQAIALKPGYAEAHYNLALVLKDIGLLDEAIAAYRQAAALLPTSSIFQSSLLLTLHYHSKFTAAAIAAELRHWDQRHAEPLRQRMALHSNVPEPDRRLRVGYLSPDFRAHPVSTFLLPLLANHHREQFEVFAYAEVASPDSVTAELRAYTDQWRNTVDLSDDQVTEMIRADKIDILIDLAMHTANNRLLVLARKPAPVQVNYLAYVGSSGLATMDYRLSDPYLDPPGWDESIYIERTIRLPETYWCYQRPVVDLAPNTRELKPDNIRFGCLNNFCKISDPLIQLWAKILQSVPESRLLVHAPQGDHRRRLLDRFAELGIGVGRVQFLARMSLAEYFQSYQTIDITLDTLPYAGGATTCDSLWMGVPVVTLAGAQGVGRSGVSILSNVGFTELIAQTPEEYIEIAVKLAHDMPRLQQIRSALRQRMLDSPLMNAPQFTKNVEAAYRQMWQTWCRGKGISGERSNAI